MADVVDDAGIGDSGIAAGQAEALSALAGTLPPATAGALCATRDHLARGLGLPDWSSLEARATNPGLLARLARFGADLAAVSPPLEPSEKTRT